MVKKILKKIKKSEFVKNSFILASGTTIGQILPILVTPILSRIYKPEEFGVLAVFMSLTVILSLLANGRYEIAIILPVQKHHSFNILMLSVILSFSFSVFLLIIIIFFNIQIANLLKLPQIRPWLWALPISVFLLATYSSLTYFYTKTKNYKTIARSSIIRGVAMVIAQIGLFFLHNGTAALIGGYVIALFSGFNSFIIGIIKDKNLLQSFSLKKIKFLYKKYKKFPLFQMPAAVLNHLGSDLPNLLIPTFYDSTHLGYYSFSYRLLTAPSTFVGQAISKVFLQSCSELKNSQKPLVPTYVNVLKKITLLIAPFFLILLLFSKPLFTIIFGKQWTTAGLIAQILTPWLFMRFIISIMSSVLYVFEKHKTILVTQVILLLSTYVPFVVSKKLNFNFIQFTAVFTIFLTIFYLIYGYYTYIITKKGDKTYKL